MIGRLLCFFGFHQYTSIYSKSFNQPAIYCMRKRCRKQFLRRMP